MLKAHVPGYAGTTARLFGRGAFVALLGLALTVATVSFLTACRCMELPVRPEPPREIDAGGKANDKDKLPPPDDLSKLPVPGADPKTAAPARDLPPIPTPLPDPKAAGN